MVKPNIFMFHRVQIDKKQNINPLYFKRGMVISLRAMIELIDKLLDKGLKFGNIEQCISSKEFFHLTYDDGFIEHLEVAYILKERYSLQKDVVTFSINVGNSFYGIYTGMDIVYELIKIGKINLLLEILSLPVKASIQEIKDRLISASPHYLININYLLKDELSHLSNIFLSKNEVKKLSSLFTIAAHGITHRNLICNKEYTKQEILKAKKEIEQVTKQVVEVFCYPEGKNDKYVQYYVKEAGYKFGLSIRHENNNKFCIGRKIPDCYE